MGLSAINKKDILFISDLWCLITFAFQLSFFSTVHFNGGKMATHGSQVYTS